MSRGWRAPDGADGAGGAGGARRRGALALGLLAGVVAACASAPSSQRARLGDAVLPAPSVPVSMPSPARARRGAAVSANAACEACHDREAREWRGSLHQRANVEPAYRRSFAREPLPFCRACHVPESDPLGVETEAESALGVGCVTCHVTGADEAVLAAPLGERTARDAPHPVVRDARFAGPSACAGCHEFAFPTASGRADGDMMQTTIREHAASRDAATPCASCHMRDPATGARSHAFAASRDPSVLRSAARIEATRTGPERVRVTLTPRAPGHAFPTGDLFRRLEIAAEVAGPDEMVLGSAARYLTRHFVLRANAAGRRLVLDDRPRDAEVSIDLELGEVARGRPIVWRVAYQRVAHPIGVDDADAEIEGEIPLASGRLSP